MSFMYPLAGTQEPAFMACEQVGGGEGEPIAFRFSYPEGHGISLSITSDPAGSWLNASFVLRDGSLRDEVRRGPLPRHYALHLAGVWLNEAGRQMMALLEADIAAARARMNRLADERQFDLSDPDVLAASVQVDQLLNVYAQLRSIIQKTK